MTKYGYSPHLLPYLNRYLVRVLFGKPRHPETGEIILRDKGGHTPTWKEQFFAKWRGMGLAEHRIAATWEQQYAGGPFDG